MSVGEATKTTRRIVPYMSRFDRRARTGLLVGALAMFFALDVAFLLSMAGLPFVADSLGQAIIDVLPGFISIPLIEALHQWAKILLGIGVLVLFEIDGAATGLLAAAPGRRAVRRAPAADARRPRARGAGSRRDRGDHPAHHRE